MVLFDVGETCSITILERSINLASNAENVMNRPRVVCGLYGKEGDLDVRGDLFGKETLPLFVLIGCHTLLCGRIHLFIGEFHEVLEYHAVSILLDGVMG